MYTIEPKRVTTMTAVITLDQLQIAAVLADPAPLLADLRGLLKQWKALQPQERQNGHVAAISRKPRRTRRPNWATDGHAHPKPQRGKKAAEKKSGSGPARKQRCPKCHQDFERLAKHLPHCQGQRDPFASPISASSVDRE